MSVLASSVASAQAPYDQRQALAIGGFAGQSLASNDARLLYGNDFNADGRLDLVVKNRNTVTVYANQDDGDFALYWSSTDLFAGLSGAVASGDLNGDGKTDLLISYPNTLQALINNGAGFSASPSTVPLQSIGPRPMLNDVALADFDRDGKLDIVALDTDPMNPARFYVVDGSVVRHRESAAMLWGLAGGVFAADAARPRIRMPEYPLRARVFDFDGDGRPELMSSNAGSLLFQFNAAASGFAGNSLSLFPVASKHGDVLGMTSGDLNGDGRSDFIISYYASNITPVGGSYKIKPYRNSTHPTLPFALNADPLEIPVAFPVNGLANADFNGDGLVDLIAAVESGNGTSIALYASRGDFSFDPPLNIAGGYNAGEVVTGYFNSDKRPDIAVVDTDNNRVVTYLHR